MAETREQAIERIAIEYWQYRGYRRNFRRVNDQSSDNIEPFLRRAYDAGVASQRSEPLNFVECNSCGLPIERAKTVPVCPNCVKENRPCNQQHCGERSEEAAPMPTQPSESELLGMHYFREMIRMPESEKKHLKECLLNVEDCPLCEELRKSMDRTFASPHAPEDKKV